MNNNLKIIVPCYNCEKWIKRCIDSITSQTYKNWDMVIIDDASTDKTFEVTNQNFDGSIWSNEHNKGALKNIIDGIAGKAHDSEDIIVLVDGDDWLAHNNVFERINEEYQDPNVWLTYGQYKHLSEKHRGICSHLTNTQRYRKYRSWRTSHLRTFKNHLWNKVKDEDLRDKSGNYYKMTWDLAFMFPMIEMAGLNRIKYIRDLLYIYNDLNPINDDKKNRKLQLDIEAEIRAKEQYQEL